MHVHRNGILGDPRSILIHGLGATLFTWRDLVAALVAPAPSASSFYVEAVDLIGFGSTGPAPSGFGYTMRAQAEAVIEALALDGTTPIRLIGHSMGGGICCHMIQALVDKYGEHSVEKLVLIDAAVYAGFNIGAIMLAYETDNGDPPNDDVKTLFDGVNADEEDAYRSAVRMLRLNYRDPALITAEQVEAYGRGFLISGEGALQRHGANIFEDAAAAGALLPGFKMPALVVWGQKDVIAPWPHYGEKVSNDLGGPVDVLSLPDCGHTPHEERPYATISQIAAFLS